VQLPQAAASARDVSHFCLLLLYCSYYCCCQFPRCDFWSGYISQKWIFENVFCSST